MQNNQNNVQIRPALCYNQAMAVVSEKKSDQILMKIVPSTMAELAQISEIEDRPLGYVARELMLRGLALYREDGRVRSLNSPHAAADAVTEAIKRAIPADIGQPKKFGVVARIDPPIDPKAEVRRMVNEDEIKEMERRTTPRKTMNVPTLKQNAK